VWELARSALYHRRRTPTLASEPTRPGQKDGPREPCSEERLLGHIRQGVASSAWHGEGHHKVWTRLRFRGIRTAQHRVVQLMRETGPLARPVSGGPTARRSAVGASPPANWT
jgi:hypothetical protein